MEFHLRRKSEVSKELLDEYPVWAEYYEPGDVDSICAWGIARDVVVAMLEAVDWSDEFMFPVLRLSDAARFQFFYASAQFRTADGRVFAGYAFNEGPTSIGIFHDGEPIILNQCNPSISEEEETRLKQFFRAAIYPLEISFCAYDLQRRVLDPYEKESNRVARSD